MPVNMDETAAPRAARSEPPACPPEADLVRATHGLSPRQRTLLVLAECLFVVLLIVVWFTSRGVKQSTSLLVLFLYSFPSEFLIAILPHEPVLIYFGKFFTPATVMAVALSGTLLVEATNYFAISHIFDLRSFQKIKSSAFVDKVVKLFLKAPFAALWIASFTPIIFYPFRFLVVLAKYPAWKFVLATALGRAPRFFLLALLGKLINVPNSVLILFTLTLVLSGAIPYLRNYFRQRRARRAAAAADEDEGC
jgi:membrane protein YqaA with SNARE-associated domain